MADNHTMEELLQSPTEGYGEAIVIPKIKADHFEIKTNLLQLVQANPYHGFERENPQTHINNFKRITLTLKFKDVPNDVIKLMMFPYSLEGNARVWYDKEPPNSILTWEDLAWERFKKMLRACPHHRFTEIAQIDTFYNGLTDNDQDSLNAAAGGNLLSKTTREALQIIENKSKVRYSRNKPNVSRMNTTSRDNTSKSDDMIDKLADQISTLVDIFSKKIVTPAPVKAVEESCFTCGGNHAYYNCPNTDRNQPSVYMAMGTHNQVAPQNHASNYMAPPGFVSNQSSTSGTLSSNTIPNPKGEMKAITARSGVAYEGPSIPTPKKTFPKPNIPYPLRLNDQKLHEKAMNQMEEFFQIFQDLHFDISFADALILMPKFASTIKSFLTNNDKLFELAKISLNENSSAMLLKKLPKKLGDTGKFLISCDFLRMDVCHALADLGASINLMPLSIWKKLSLPELTPTRMTLELADRSITRPKGVAEDVFVKVGKFYFPTDFVVVDFEVDPRVPLILGRSFLRTGRALLDVCGEEITFRVNDEAVTYNLNQTTRYSSTMMICRNSSGGNPTSTFEPILSDSSPSLTPFEGSDFILEEIDAYLKDESISSEIDHASCDSEGDICLIENLLNDDPFQLPLMDLKQGEVAKAKSLIEEPPELELKDLPSHLEYAYIEVLQSHKRAIACIITDIKGIDPRFSTHKILMEEDYKPAVQSQRQVNPKIHEVIKKEVIKLLDAGMIYLISDSPWVSPMHCVLKKDGITVAENENNELIPKRLVTGWRVCIDYRKLNDATRKDHFPLPYMVQMLERLAWNKYYYFLDRFSGYFQILINPPDQEKTIFTCTYGTFAYHRMPFGLCNALGTFQSCMMVIFYDMIEKTMEVFMHDFSVFGDSFSSCLSQLDTMLRRCDDTNLVLNWEKCHFMVKERIVLGHKISKNRLEVNCSKVDVIIKLPYPTPMKGVKSFLGHVGFYQRFIQDFSKIARPMTHLLEKETLFLFSKDCIDAFETLKKKLTEASILVVPDWNLPFELMCDASDFEIGAVLGQHKTKYFQPIHYASKTMTEAQIHYTTTEKEMPVIVYAFEKFRPYLVLSKSIVYTDHSALKYLLSVYMAKKLMISLKLVMKDPPGAIMVPILPPRKDEMPQNVIQVDYFAKWVKAKALPANDARVVVKFLKSLFARFGTPRAIISDRGIHFCNDKFAKVISKYGVTHRLSTAYHPQTSGQVEVSNRGLKRILERMVGENRASWSEKLDDALWAFRTAYKTPIGCTPYKLVYGKSCHLPIELEHKSYWALKHVNFNLKTAGDHWKIFLGKLKTRWSGPFTITKVFSYGTVELSQPDGLNFKVNGHRVKHYFGGDVPLLIVPNLQTFPMDK
nr:reverse transcriptase domain-containing protein [Tanacetum cinerariifolium]